MSTRTLKSRMKAHLEICRRVAERIHRCALAGHCADFNSQNTNVTSSKNKAN